MSLKCVFPFSERMKTNVVDRICADCKLERNEIKRLEGGYEYMDKFRVGKYICFLQQKRNYKPYTFYKQYLDIKIIKRTPKFIEFIYKDNYENCMSYIKCRKKIRVVFVGGREYVDMPRNSGFEYNDRLFTSDLIPIRIPSIVKKNKEEKAINIIKEWFLDVRYNPKYKYCRKRIDKMYDDEFN